MYQWEFNFPSDIASGRIAEAWKGMISAEPMHASHQKCWSIFEFFAKNDSPSRLKSKGVEMPNAFPVFLHEMERE